MAEYTERSLPEKAVLSSCSPNDDTHRAVKSGRVGGKLCHHEQPKEEGLTTLATFGRFVCSIMRGRTVLEELLERDAVAELDNYRD